jgi:LPXTG-site transpeptidase (sortase) family protein
VRRRIKKSQILILGSFLVFVGVIMMSSDYLIKIRNEVFTDMAILMSGEKEEVVEVPNIEKVSEESVVENNSSTTNTEKNEVINYDKYYGVLEIPRISLKRGFYNLDSKYNNIEYNVTMVYGSTMPDVSNGNLILMAHSGTAYIAYFEYLYRLNINDLAYITYKGKKYKYKLVNTYNVPKTGSVEIIRNYDKTTLTLITCTNNDDSSQSIYIFELV